MTDQTITTQQTIELTQALDAANAILVNLKELAAQANSQVVRLTSMTSEIETLKNKSVEAALAVERSQVSVTANEQKILTFCDSALEKSSQCASVLAEAIEANEKVKALAIDANMTEARLVRYEAQLNLIIKTCSEQQEIIDSLLPNAASAGLATAFLTRGQTFVSKIVMWERVYLGALLGLLLVGGSLLLSTFLTSTVHSYDELFRLYITRLPFAGALIWLILIASNQLGLAKRLEEDYGYKAAVSTALTGFSKHMSEMESKATAGSPLAKLYSDTLATIATPPGLIYENHPQIETPLDKAIVVGKATSSAVLSS